MAKNTGHGHRVGAVKDRTQTFNPKNKRFVKRDADTGRFMDVNHEKNKTFKGVEKEK